MVEVATERIEVVCSFYFTLLVLDDSVAAEMVLDVVMPCQSSVLDVGETTVKEELLRLTILANDVCSPIVLRYDALYLGRSE